jgi:peptidoglycan/LPS O-acetylase OafA/YrhL/LysM repeat protein
MSPNTMTKRRLPYMPGLDGLRALAVIAVLLYHADLPWIPGGFLGVEVFFVLSGFLITSLLLAEWRSHSAVNLKVFWQRRARRLLPALFLVLGATLTYAVAFLPDEVARLRADAIAGATYLSNWHLILSNTSYFEAVGRPSLLRHLWSLGVEGQFYLLWPLVFVFLMSRWRPRRAVVPVLTVAALSAVLMAVLFEPYADPSRIYFGTDTRATGLLIGAALAYLWSTARISERGAQWSLEALGIGALGALMVLHLRLNEFQPFLYQGGCVLVGLATAALIAVTVHPRAQVVPALLSLGVLRWIGLRSYGIYLWHWPVFMLTRPQLDVGIEGTPLLVARLSLTLLLAALSYRFVETPIRRGVLGQSWRTLQEARGLERQRLGVRWASALTLLAIFVLLLGRSAARAQPPAPPSYLTLTAINGTVSSSTSQLAPRLVKPTVRELWPGQLTVGSSSSEALTDSDPMRSAPVTAATLITPTTRLGQAGLALPSADVHIVKDGEDLFSIASQYRTSVDAVAKANNIVHPGRISPGQHLLVPDSRSGMTVGARSRGEEFTQWLPHIAVPAADNQAPLWEGDISFAGAEAPVSMMHVLVQPTPAVADQIIHVVTPGENLFRIGLQYGVTFEAIASANNILDPSHISAGQRLVVPVRRSEVAWAATPTARPPAQPTPAPALPATADPVVPSDSTVASATQPAPDPVPSNNEAPVSLPRITAIGDSVMLGAVQQLASALGAIDIDAQISRQASAIVGLLQARKASGRLGEVVIVHVGNNGILSAPQIDEMMQLLADVRRVVFVNVRIPRRWESLSNAALAEKVPLYPNAVLVDWYSASINRPELFWSDGIHLRPEGAQVYAALIAAAAAAP